MEKQLNVCERCCDCCDHYCYEAAESNERVCNIFGYEIPEEFENSDGDGCTCSDEYLEELCKIDEEAWLKDKEERLAYFESLNNQ